MSSPRTLLVTALSGAFASLALHFLRLRRLRRRFQEPLPGALPYRARRALLTPTEREFYTALCQAVGGRYIVCIKVRLADVIDCPPAVWRLGYGRLVAQKHLDFVLCDPATTRVRAAVELDDRSHARRARRARDRFVEAALHAAGVPLIRLPAASAYRAHEVSRTVKKALG
jgi:hypothetical protein